MWVFYGIFMFSMVVGFSSGAFEPEAIVGVAIWVYGLPLLLGAAGISKAKKRVQKKAIQDQHEAECQYRLQTQQQIHELQAAAQQPQMSDAERLEGYKELLDSGVITQEEFAAKKAQILASSGGENHA
jgi:hypothetical protein